jgi:tetratricopeptide (TPR) repeat protein
LYEREENFDAAEREYRIALSLKPRYLQAHLNMGNLFYKKNEFPAALAHYVEVIEIDPQHAQAHNNLAVIYYYQEEFEKAWEHLIKAEESGIQIHPDFKNELLKKIKGQSLR